MMPCAPLHFSQLPASAAASRQSFRGIASCRVAEPPREEDRAFPAPLRTMAEAPKQADDGDLDTTNLLIVVLDTNPYTWAHRGGAGASAGSAATTANGGDANDAGALPGLQPICQSLIVFLRAFCALHRLNELAVVANHVGGVARFLYPVPPPRAHAAAAHAGRELQPTRFEQGLVAYRHQAGWSDTLVAELRRLVAAPLPGGDGGGGADADGDAQMANGGAGAGAGAGAGDDDGGGARRPMLAAALSLALCYANRRQKADASLRPRVLVLQATPDAPAQYIAVMNAVFAAQRLRVPVDAAVLLARDREDSAFLQQACYLTGGLYVHPKPARTRHAALVQVLLEHFLPTRGGAAAAPLARPRHNVDLRATCFRTGESVTKGYVCSVCLSIFAKRAATCSTCGVRVKLPDGGRAAAARQRAAGARRQRAATDSPAPARAAAGARQRNSSVPPPRAPPRPAAVTVKTEK